VDLREPGIGSIVVWALTSGKEEIMMVVVVPFLTWMLLHIPPSGMPLSPNSSPKSLLLAHQVSVQISFLSVSWSKVPLL